MPNPSPWRPRFRHALEAAQVARARRRRVAAGFTNNVDLVIKLDDDTRRKLDQTEPSLPAGELPPRIRDAGDLVSALLYHMRHGSGDVLAIDSAELSDAMAETFRGRYQLGGTGAQAANTLSHLGFEALLHVTGLSETDVSVFDPSGRIVVARQDGLAPLPEAIRPGDRPSFHFVFEFDKGSTLRAGGQAARAARANRIILYHDPVNSELTIDPYFVQAVPDPASRVRTVLLSGFTGTANVEVQRRLIDETAGYADAWRETRPELLFHLELASVTEPAFLHAILDRMLPHVDSVGINEDEADLVAAEWDLPRPRDAEARLDVMRAIRDRTGVSRVGLHTQDYCMALTGFDPHRERDSLLFAALVAGTRARLAEFPKWDDLPPTLADGAPSADALAVERRFGERFGLDEGIAAYPGDGWLVWTPTLMVPDPKGTVGLGDTFTGGLMALVER